MKQSYIFENLSPTSQMEFYTFTPGLTSEDIENVFKLVEELPYTQASIGTNKGRAVVDNYRRSNVKWIPQNESTKWLYEKLVKLIIEANDKLWHFDLSTISEQIQYTEYPAGGGHYDWHADCGANHASIRKISITVQLTSSDEYTGGDLQIFNNNQVKIASRDKGNVVIFPSYLMHRVSPVEAGLRKSLVLWVGGAPFR